MHPIFEKLSSLPDAEKQRVFDDGLALANSSSRLIDMHSSRGETDQIARDRLYAQAMYGLQLAHYANPDSSYGDNSRELADTAQEMALKAARNNFPHIATVACALVEANISDHDDRYDQYCGALEDVERDLCEQPSDNISHKEFSRLFKIAQQKLQESLPLNSVVMPLARTAPKDLFVRAYVDSLFGIERPKAAELDLY